MPKTQPEYAIRQGMGPNNEIRYEVVKFTDDKEHPANIYDVHFRSSGLGYCNCYAGAKKGNDDKHVKLVRQWIAESRPPGKLYTI